MKAGQAFVAGVIAGLAMLLAMVIGWLSGTLRLDSPMLLGSFITGDLSVATWVLGAIIHFLICGLVALIYAAIFEAARRSAWWLGMVIAGVNWAISGSLLPLLPLIHPLVPQFIIGPGAFAFNYGAANMLWFLGLHLLYGAVVGVIYICAHTREPAPVEREPMHGEHGEPVASGELGHGG